MGAVYKAQHRLMDRVVALKVIRPELLEQSGAIKRFQREVKAAACLAHPNIVMAFDAEQFDAEQAGDLHFLAMEFIEGENLADVVRKHGPLPAAQACDHVRQALLGLQHAHEQGMVHRDLKPSNLMRTPSGVVKILDFGLARLVRETAPDDALTQTGMVMGTVDFIAPEQATGAHEADIRADIYSLGCTLFFLLTGKPPFASGTLAKKLLQHQQDEPPDIVKLRSDLPAGPGAVVRKMLAKRPHGRYQTPVEAAAVLAPFAKPEAGTPAPCRRWPWIAGLAAAAVLLVAAYTIIRIITDYGELEIATAEDGVEIRVMKAGKEVELFDPKTRETMTLRSGKYELKLADGADGLVLTTDRFELKRGGRVVVEVRRKVAPAAVAPPRQLPEFTNSIGIKLLRIPAGNFVMGSPKEEEGRDRGEVQHEVHLTKPFYLGKYEVTLGQFRDFVNAAKHKTDAEKSGTGRGYDPAVQLFPAPKQGFTWRNVGWEQTDEHPVGNVSWLDATAFCAWLSKKEQRVYRLPTEAEWEYSCCAGATTRFGNGNALHDLAATANVADASFRRKIRQGGIKLLASDDRFDFTAPVGSFLPNAFGLHDMHGNVWEWCFDRFGGNYYENSPKENPTGPTTTVVARVLRGGSFASVPLDCRAANRTMFVPAYNSCDVGFRVLLEQSPAIDALAVNKLITVPLAETRELVGHRDGVSSLAFSPDGHRAVSGGGPWAQGDNGLYLWDVETGMNIKRLDGHTATVHGVAFTPDGNHIVSGAVARELFYWDITSGKFQRAHGVPYRIWGIALAPDGKQVLTATFDSDAKGPRLWGVPGLKLARSLPGPDDTPYAVAFSPQGDFAVTAGGWKRTPDLSIWLWDTQTGTKLHCFHGHTGRVQSAVFTPDGKHIISGSADSTIRIWDIAKGTEVGQLRGHVTAVLTVAVSPNGRWLASGGADGIVRIWDLDARWELYRFVDHVGSVNAVAFSPTGQHLLFGGDRGLRLWRAPAP